MFSFVKGKKHKWQRGGRGGGGLKYLLWTNPLRITKSETKCYDLPFIQCFALHQVATVLKWSVVVHSYSGRFPVQQFANMFLNIAFSLCQRVQSSR